MDDEELIDRIAGGDEAAMRLLFVRHAPWPAARLRSVLAAPDVQDVLQETFLAVWRGAREQGERPLPGVGPRRTRSPVRLERSRGSFCRLVIELSS